VEGILGEPALGGFCHALGFFGPFQIVGMSLGEVACVMFDRAALSRRQPIPNYQSGRLFTGLLGSS